MVARTSRLQPARAPDPHGAPDWRAAVTGLLAQEIREELA